MTVQVPTVTEPEARALTDAIKVAAENLHALLLRAYEVGAWRSLGYASWRDYAMTEFGMSQSYAYRLLDQARVVREIEAIATVSPMGEIAERQARELAPLLDKPDELRATWQEAVERSDGEVPTAAVVRGVREERAEYEATATPEPRQAPRPQLPDQFFKGVRELTKAMERLERLVADDRLARNAEQIAAKYRGDLLRAAAVLADVLQRLSIQQ